MASVYPAFAPLGRLYEPLLDLAARVHRATVKRQQTLWIDDRGSIFLNDAALLQHKPPGSIIGTYHARTPLGVIESDLRLALRERARRWILDWNTPTSIVRRQDAASLLPPKPRRRSRKAAPETEKMLEHA